MFLKMKFFLANIADVVVSTGLFITHGRLFKQNFPKATFSFSPDSILDHLLHLGVQEKFIKETFFEHLDKDNVALLTREKVIEKFELLRTNKGHKHKLSSNENFFTQCHQVFDFYKRNFDQLMLQGRINQANCLTEYPALFLMAEAKQNITALPISQVLVTVDRMVANACPMPTYQQMQPCVESTPQSSVNSAF